MYLDVSSVSKNGQTYTRVLLRESYREDGKVKKRTLANLSQCTPDEIEAIRLALRHKDNLVRVNSVIEILSLKQGSSIGAVWLIYEVARRLGIVEALGHSKRGKLALWQVIARVIDQGSRLSAVRLAGSHAACEVLNLDGFHEEMLYANLDWLNENQSKIEKKLFSKLYGKNKAELFLYDVTSSYLEGNKNELSAFGYNRDKKKGKKQIVIGLLCDKEGVPVSIEVFQGNTQDTKTFQSQIQKVVKRFGGNTVTFVGDRGMIKGPQIKELKNFKEPGFHYITAITKAQVEKLLKEEKIQIRLFDDNLSEVLIEENRYILRKNPHRAKELKNQRHEKYQLLEEVVQEQNHYLQEHSRAKPEVAKRKIENKSKQLKVNEWVDIFVNKRQLVLSQDEDRLKEVSKLDGCYVLKTDLPVKKVSKEVIHKCYKELAQVEWAFRTCKTGQLEIRPVYVRLEGRTRGHAFVVMLAYRIVKELASYWKSFDLTVEEGIKELSSLCVIEVTVKDTETYNQIPEPRDLGKKLLEAARVKLPKVLPNKGINVVTKKNLTTRRKF